MIVQFLLLAFGLAFGEMIVLLNRKHVTITVRAEKYVVEFELPHHILLSFFLLSGFLWLHHY